MAEIIWHGTASIEIRCPEGRILFDPFVQLPGGERKMSVAEYDGFPDVFLTHGHFDHIANIPEIVRRNPDTRVFCTRAPFMTLVKKGVPEDIFRRIGYGDEVGLPGFTIKAFRGKHAETGGMIGSVLLNSLKSPARSNLPYILREHFSSPEKHETVFYLIECEGRRIGLMGSMNLRNAAEYPAGCDVLVLPYNGWKDNYTHAVRIVERLEPKRILLDHYDVAFPPLTMPLDLTPFLEKYPGRAEALVPLKPVEI